MKPKEITFVKFLGADQGQISWGSNDDPNPLLKVGDTYEVADIEVHSWHTKIQLVGFEGKKFNDASFEYLRGEAKDEALKAWKPSTA